MKEKNQPKGRPNNTPDIPDDRNDTDKRYTFNLGMYRIDLLAELLEVCAKKYRKAIVKRTQKSVNDYKAMVNTLYTETYIYMEDETNFKLTEHTNVKMDKEAVLNTKLDDFSDLNTDKQIIEELKQVRTIYLEIRKLLKQVGMDIPEEQKIGETEAFINS